MLRNFQVAKENHKKTRTRQTRQFFPFLRPDFSFEVLQLRRNMFSLVVQICTGHNYMKRQQHIIDTANKVKSDGPVCTLCKEGEMTSQHIIGECGPLNSLRESTFGFPQLSPPFLLSKTALVNFLRKVPIDELQFFIQEN